MKNFSLNFIQEEFEKNFVEEFDFKFGQKGYENGNGNEIRFEGNIYAFLFLY